METPVIECPRCNGKRTKFKSMGVRNVDQVYEVRSCLLCGVDFNYTKLGDTYVTSYDDHLEPIEANFTDDASMLPIDDEFTQCVKCGKMAVLKSEWFKVCPSCLFLENLQS